MPTPDAFRWFKQTFGSKVDAAIAGTPFSTDLVAAIAAQETGHIWNRLRTTLSVDAVLALCVGDTLDADKGRKAFPRTQADLVAAPRGAEMFAIAHEELVKMAARVPGFTAVAARPNKFCHGFGIFQYDLQFFKVDPDYFLERRWRDFDASLAKCLEELESAMKRIGMAARTTLSDLERVHVAIAYNSGRFDPAKGLEQGFFDGQKFYGERIFGFLQMSQGVSVPPAVAPSAGSAPAAGPG